MCFFTISFLSVFILSHSFFVRLSMCCKQKIKLGFQKIVVVNKIAFIMQTNV